MNDHCGCCTNSLPGKLTANRPGLPALAYRVGTHATFLETMKSRLSSADFPELARLKTRAASDPAIALLDAWATVADVLTFYQERIANEGYLRTATERRSVLQLARLVGYALRPGVASTAYLAYTLDEDRSVMPPKPTSVTIPAKRALAQSVPGPGELPQSFETSEKLSANSSWNNLQVRLTRPQTRDSITAGLRVFLKGITTNLVANDPLLFVFEKKEKVQTLYRVVDVQPDATANRTLVTLRDWNDTPPPLADQFDEVINRFREAVRAAGLGNRAVIRKVIKPLTPDQPADDLMVHLENVALPAVVAGLSAAQTHNRAGELVPLLKKLAAELTRISRHSSAVVAAAATVDFKSGVTHQNTLLGHLLEPPSLPPANSAQLRRKVEMALAENSNAGLQLMSTFQPALRDALPTALANANVTEASGIKVYAFRVKAAPFGSQSRRRQRVDRNTQEITDIGEWPIIEWRIGQEDEIHQGPIRHEHANVVYLDASYDKLLASSAKSPSWIVIDSSALEQPDDPKPPKPQVEPAVSQGPLITEIARVQAVVSRADYGLSGKTTRIELTNAWLSFAFGNKQPEEIQATYDVDFRVIRRTTVYAQSEELELADEPIEMPVCTHPATVTPAVPTLGFQAGIDPSDREAQHADTRIELDRLYRDLQPGRWLIVSGERADIGSVPGVNATELVMLAGVTQDVSKNSPAVESSALPGDKNHTFLQLADKGLSYCYKRDTVKIFGNVVKVTHGETRSEVLGSGDGSQTLQQFSLRQPPLTFVAAANSSGVESTLELRVNDVLWHETDSLAEALPTDRNFITRTDDDGTTTVVFGNGMRGARLPSGQENVKAVYRNGIGKGGNVKADQISLLATRPLGVKSVTNPMPATGGADRESRDQARQNAPLAVMALDRLVSTQDYADFARTFAGIGKASAVRLSDGHRQLVHVTIAGVDDIPIAKSSDLYRNLLMALQKLGDPFLPIQVETRELLLLVVEAGVRVLPDYQWESVKPKIIDVLLDRFSFQRRDLGQDAIPSEVVSTIQAVEGVAYVDLDRFGALSEEDVVAALPRQSQTDVAKVTLATRVVSSDQRVTVDLARIDRQTPDLAKRVKPAQLAYLSPNVEDTLILNELTP